MIRNRTRHTRVSIAGLVLLLMGIHLVLVPSSRADGFVVTNLVTNDQSINSAKLTDGDLVNAWGISFGPTSPFWVSDNGTGLSTLYSVDKVTNAVTKQGLIVSIPGDGSVTGQVFNGGSSFNGDRFLFASEDGTISGWRNTLGTTAEVLQTGSTDGPNVYKGITLETTGGHTYMLSANFRQGTIDVMKGDAGAPDLAGKFLDPTIPSGFAPFNVQEHNGVVYVTYALQDSTKHDDVAGAGNGYVNAFDLQGNLLGRVGSAGDLNSPWGMAFAPSSFGAIAGDLLVGNFGDGHINVFDTSTDTFIGQLLGTDGKPLAIDGLWGLTFGNGGSGGSTRDLYFSAGPNGETAGLFGVIAPVPEPGPALLALMAMGSLTARWYLRRGPSRPSE